VWFRFKEGIAIPADEIEVESPKAAKVVDVPEGAQQQIQYVPMPMPAFYPPSGQVRLPPPSPIITPLPLRPGELTLVFGSCRALQQVDPQVWQSQGFQPLGAYSQPVYYYYPAQQQ
jgi:hypothetical protein